MYLAIIILPLLASISSGFFGRKIGVSGAQLISTGCIMITTLFAAITFFEVGLNNIPVSLSMFKWIDSESLNIYWGFNFDSLTVSMLIPVLIVSSLVHLYSVGYMSHDPHNQRFFSYLSLFTFMMIILVTANNFLLMFVGWEGVGICSYLLVSFWFTRIAANQSSMSAFLTNRVGDCLLTIGMFALLWCFGNIDYSTVFSLSAYMNENTITIIGVCLLIGAMAKSSQVGLHIWLPQAMEGPTPVSALIHAATMVTAGVYLLMRSSPLIEYSSIVLLLCLWIGAITTVFSSLIGLYQQDIKKVIAYSTMSQLGMMVIAVGLSSYNVALFHLVNHAFYKALLFLGAGAVIHAVADNQDFRKFGGLKQFLPLTYSVMLIASLSLVAFPFMTGFYSKDFILESAFGQFCFSSIVIYFIATIGAMFTTLYSVKVLYLTFLSNPAGPLTNYRIAHEGDIFMSLPLIILALFSIFFGYFTKDIFIGLATNFYMDNSIFIHPNHEIMIDTEFAVPTLFKLLPLILTITLSVLSLILSEFYYKTIVSFKFSKLGYNIFSFFNQRFYVELFYNRYIVEIILKMGGQTTKVLDKGSIELIGPFGLEKGLIYLSKNISNLDTGIITNYALYILIGLISYILIPYLANYTLVIVLLFGLLILTGNKNYNDAIVNKNYLKSKLSINFTLLVNILISTSIIFIYLKLPSNIMLHIILDNYIIVIPLMALIGTIIFRLMFNGFNSNVENINITITFAYLNMISVCVILNMWSSLTDISPFIVPILSVLGINADLILDVLQGRIELNTPATMGDNGSKNFGYLCMTGNGNSSGGQGSASSGAGSSGGQGSTNPGAGGNGGNSVQNQIWNYLAGIQVVSRPYNDIYVNPIGSRLWFIEYMTKAEYHMKEELIDSKETLRRAKEKYASFTGRAYMRDPDTDQYVGWQQDMIVSFEKRINQLEEKYKNIPLSPETSVKNGVDSCERITRDYINLVNFNKAQEEAYHTMYVDHGTRRVVRRTGEYEWLHAENPTPSENTLGYSMFPWKNKIRRDYEYWK